MSAIKPRTARVVIYQGDDLDTLSDHDAKVAAANAAVDDAEDAAKRVEKAGGTRLMSDSNPAADAQSDYATAQARRHAVTVERDEFATEAEDRGVVVVLHALPRKAWRALVAEHPARDQDKHPEDYPIGPCNIETMPDALLPMSIDREQSTIDGDLVEFLESLSDYDYYDRLFLTAFALNRGSALADPTLRLGSVPSQTSNATSS